MGCAEILMEYFLIGLNAIFALAGLTVLGLGAFVLIEVKEFSVGPSSHII